MSMEQSEEEFEAEMKREHERRYMAVRMAVSGEWSALAKQLELWGIEPLE